MTDSPHAGSIYGVTPPDYSTILSWWDAWPEARPELLDFWARGNFTRRLHSRRQGKRLACIVRVRYVDEMEAAAKRLALLDVDIDFAWCGYVTPPQLVMLPQDIEYEGPGGWGYLAAAGDSFSEHRGGREWCPSLGWASLLPDTVTDWLARQARSYVEAGHIMVAPVGNVGLNIATGGISEQNLQTVSQSQSIVRELTRMQVLFDLELPHLDGMSIQDVHKFCEDHQDSLILFQSALAKILKETTSETPDDLRRELLSQIREGVAELRLSDKTIAARKALTALGASISTFLVTVGIQLGIPAGAAAIGSTGAAMAALAQWAQILDIQGTISKKPFYIVWALQKGRGPKSERRERPFLQEFPLKSGRKPKQIPPFHWLTPPTGGWLVPSARRV